MSEMTARPLTAIAAHDERVAGGGRSAFPASVHRLQERSRSKGSRVITTRRRHLPVGQRRPQDLRRDVGLVVRERRIRAARADRRGNTPTRALPFYNAFFQTANPPAIELAELLAELTPPQFEHVFYADSGSEGNDTIVRMVRRYWDLRRLSPSGT